MITEQPTQNLQMIVIVNHKIYLSRSQTFPDQSDKIDKPARLIIRLLFRFAFDLINSTNLQIVRRQCCLIGYI